MQILSFTPTASTTQALNPVLFGKPAKASTSAPAAQPAASNAQASAAPASTTPAAPTAHTRSSHGHAAPAASSSAATTAETMVSAYSTTIAGKQYSGSVEESGGQYTASVPSVPGASATGSSLVAAENNLNIRIDELV